MSGPLRGATTSAVACRKHARRTLLVGILVAPPLNFHAYGSWPPLLPCISASSRAAGVQAGSNLQAWAQELDRSHASPGAQTIDAGV